MPRNNTAVIAESFFGEKPYQRLARRSLPILVRQATSGRAITYGELANELSMPNPRNLNYVLGSIGQTLIDLDKRLEKEIPPIQCLVINQATGLPGSGVGWFIDQSDFKQLPAKQRREVVNFHLYRIFSYRQWDAVLAALDLSPLPNEHSDLIEGASRARGGESVHHKELKEAIASDPTMIGLPKTTKLGIVEYALPSGDSLDVYFHRRNLCIGVEVKSRISDRADVVRGMFQCIKYQAVLEAKVASLGIPHDVRVVLAHDCPFPEPLVSLKNVLGVEVFKVKREDG